MLAIDDNRIGSPDKVLKLPIHVQLLQAGSSIIILQPKILPELSEVAVQCKCLTRLIYGTHTSDCNIYLDLTHHKHTKK